MTNFGSQPNRYASDDVDAPSPNGRLHAVVVRRGDIGQNTNIFSILIFRTDELLGRPRPDTVLTLASSSNDPAISHVKWLEDNHTLAFLGEHAGQLPQVYTLDVRTKQYRALTHHPTKITSYDIAPYAGVIVYAAKPAPDTSQYGLMRQHGFALRPAQFVGDVLTGAWAPGASDWLEDAAQLYVWKPGMVAAIPAQTPGPTYASCDLRSLALAPTGRLALIRCTRQKVPAQWHKYTEPYLARLIAVDFPLSEFALLDVDNGTVRPLVDAPILGFETVRWAPSGEAVVLSDAFLPLEVSDTAQRRLRAGRTAVAEVNVRTGRVTVVSYRQSLGVVGWDSVNTIDLVTRGPSGSPEPATAPRVRYRKTIRGWIEVPGEPAMRRPVPILVIEEGLNLAPRLIAIDRATGRRAIVLDPNPQLAKVRLGRERVLRWRTKSGRERVGGLYLPSKLIPGARYPLVIQTHGFDSTRFALDGVFPTATAAQPLAAQDVLVLQVDDGGTQELLRRDEAQRAMEAFEGAIDKLDSLGLVDRRRVGLIGFSRTCYQVLYMLTHSRYPIAAAAITDGVDFSYLQYMLFKNAVPGPASEFESMNGGPPFGKGLDLWRERAPGFALNRITAPLRIEAIKLGSVLEMWEPYAALLAQHKPVEMFVIPQGVHLLVKPWERLASSGDNLDWFRFWLKGQEDPDPAKAEQYARWRELRKLQQRQTLNDTAEPKSR